MKVNDFSRVKRNCQSIPAIGYKEFYEYFDGKVSFEQAVESHKIRGIMQTAINFDSAIKWIYKNHLT